MRKFAIIAGGLLAFFALAAFLIPRVIAPAQFDRIAHDTIGVDSTTDWEDGLYVFVAGAGGPLPDPLRSGPMLGVLAGDRAVLIDAGSGGVRNLAQMGFPTGRAEHLFLTHLHSDHIDGLGETLLMAWIGGGRSEPLPVTGPVGTQVVADGFMQAYARDAVWRTEHHGADIANPQGFGATVTEIPAQGSQVLLDEDGLRIIAFPVEHAPVDEAFGYRIDYGGRSVSISGDTAYSEMLVEQSRGVDVMFHEALNAEMVGTLEAAARENGADTLAKIMFDIPDYHTTPVEAAQAADEASVDALVLYHVIPPVPVRALDHLYLDGTGDQFDGDITLSRDGLLVGLPSGSDRIIYENRL